MGYSPWGRKATSLHFNDNHGILNSLGPCIAGKTLLQTCDGVILDQRALKVTYFYFLDHKYVAHLLYSNNIEMCCKMHLCFLH